MAEERVSALNAKSKRRFSLKNDLGSEKQKECVARQVITVKPASRAEMEVLLDGSDRSQHRIANLVF